MSHLYNDLIPNDSEYLTIIHIPNAVYFSGSLLTRPMKFLVGLALGNKTLATSVLLVSRNWNSLSDVAAFKNS